MQTLRYLKALATPVICGALIALVLILLQSCSRAEPHPAVFQGAAEIDFTAVLSNWGLGGILLVAIWKFLRDFWARYQLEKEQMAARDKEREAAAARREAECIARHESNQREMFQSLVDLNNKVTTALDRAAVAFSRSESGPHHAQRHVDHG